MDVTQIHHLPGSEVPAAPPPEAAPEYAQCDECGVPVDHNQRYCVSCGAHRRNVPDPAARYLGEASARARAAASATHSRQPTRRRRTVGLGPALALAVIPVAVAGGVAVGRSSNNDDARLIQALSRQRAQTVVAAAPAATGATTATAKQSTSAPAKGTAKAKAKRASRKDKSAKSATDVSASPTAKDDAEGKQIVDKLQHTKGPGFLNQLPSTVSVP